MITRLDQISKSKMLAVGACGISCGSENKGDIDNESGTEDGPCGSSYAACESIASQEVATRPMDRLADKLHFEGKETTLTVSGGSYRYIRER